MLDIGKFFSLKDTDYIIENIENRDPLILFLKKIMIKKYLFN